jgi:hypothetical protein
MIFEGLQFAAWRRGCLSAGAAATADVPLPSRFGGASQQMALRKRSIWTGTEGRRLPITYIWRTARMAAKLNFSKRYQDAIPRTCLP